MESIPFYSIGFVKETVPDNIFNLLLEGSKEAKEKDTRAVNTLVGNLEESYDIILPPEKFIFVEEYLVKLCSRYERQYNLMRYERSVISNGYTLELSRLWVNYQKKYEFNPVHHHTGLYSFVIWMKIPYDFREEFEQDRCKNSNNKCPGSFAFYYPNALGETEEHLIELDSSFEKEIIVFPARVNHCVYPFYTSDDYRISISGNMYLHARDMSDYIT